jgi:serine/threonine-protein kinase
MPSEGGVITQIGNTVVSDVFGVDWGQDGFLVYGRAEQGIWRLPVGGGVPEQITASAEHPDENIHTWPQSLDGGSLLLFSAIGTSGKWHDSKVVLRDLTTGDRYTVIEGGAYGHYVPSGHVVYVNEDGTILAVPFDLGARSTTGEAVPVESGVLVGQWGGGASFAVADAGVLAFVRGNTWERHLHQWFDRTGRRLSQLGPPMTGAWGLEIEPGGRRIATSLLSNVNDDVHFLEEGMVTPRRVTFDAASEGWPAWSPDGARIAWQSDAGEGHGQRLFTTEVDGGGEPEILYESDNGVFPRSWSPDGRWLAVAEGSPDTGLDVYVVALDDPATRIPIHTTPSDEFDPQFSPDGDWLAYESNEGGTFQVYVVSFPDVGDPQRVSLIKGRSPQWASSGGELFFWQDSTLMVATVRTDTRFGVEGIQPLFAVSVEPGEGGNYDVTPDGERFLIRVRNPAALATEIQVVVNWFEELKGRVGN